MRNPAILATAILAFGMASAPKPQPACDLAQWTCGLGAFSICAEKLKYYDPDKINIYPAPDGGWTVNPNSEAFKTCEAEEKAKCLKSKGC
jgi:hypothetical protein